LTSPGEPLADVPRGLPAPKGATDFNRLFRAETSLLIIQASFRFAELKSCEEPKGTKRRREALRGFRICGKNVIGMMNKKEASEFLGISIRQVENYAKQSKLSVRKEKGKTGDISVYDERELKRLKAELDSKRAPRPSVVTESNESTELVRASDSRLSDVSRFAETLMQMQTGNRKAGRDVAIENKPLLKLDESAALTGLSRQILRDAIRAEELKAKLIGRAYRIKRDDLDEFIKNL
jgi:excisionase family DNA binding protein